MSDKDPGQEFEFTEEELRDLDQARKNRSTATAPEGSVRKRTTAATERMSPASLDDPVSAHFGEALASPHGAPDPEELPTLPFSRDLGLSSPSGQRLGPPSSAPHGDDDDDDDDDDEGDTEIIVTVDPNTDVNRPTEPHLPAARPGTWADSPAGGARSTFDGAETPVITDSSMFNTAREIPRVKRGGPKPVAENPDDSESSSATQDAGADTSADGDAPPRGRLAVLLSALNTHTSPLLPSSSSDDSEVTVRTKGVREKGDDLAAVFGDDDPKANIDPSGAAPDFSFPDDDAWHPPRASKGGHRSRDDEQSAPGESEDLPPEDLSPEDLSIDVSMDESDVEGQLDPTDFEDVTDVGELASDDVLDEEIDEVIEAAPLVEVDMEEELAERPKKPTIPPPLPHMSGPFPSVSRDEAAVVRVAVESSGDEEDEDDDGVVTSAPSEAELIEGAKPPGSATESAASVESPALESRRESRKPRAVDRLKKTQPLERAKRPEEEPSGKGVPRGLPWFQEVFGEDYARTTPFATPKLTEIEAQLIERSLNPTHDSDILDLGCGDGRHALALATRGYKVTGYELSLPFMIQAAEVAQKRRLNVNFVRGDLRELDFEASFDAAYCMGTTFGYFDDETNRSVIQSVFRALRDGGRFFIEVANRDYLVKNLPARIWWEGDGCVVLEEVDFNYFTSRIESKRSVVFDDGRHAEHEISLRAYSLHELGKILHHAGFRVLEVSGNVHHRCRFFGSESRQLLLLAERR